MHSTQSLCQHLISLCSSTEDLVKVFSEVILQVRVLRLLVTLCTIVQRLKRVQGYKSRSVKFNNHCTMCYCSLIYELCLHKCTRFFVSTAMSWNLFASFKIFLFHQAIYQYLLDNPVSGPSFVPIVIAALYSSNKGFYIRTTERENLL